MSQEPVGRLNLFGYNIGPGLRFWWQSCLRQKKNDHVCMDITLEYDGVDKVLVTHQRGGRPIVFHRESAGILCGHQHWCWCPNDCKHYIKNTVADLLYTPQTLFVGGILFSRCPCVRPSMLRPSVTLCFLNNSKSHCWIFIKPCKHVYICKTNTLDKKVRARGQFY